MRDETVTATGEADRTLAAFALVPGWIAVGVLISIVAAGVSIPLRYRWVPLAVSVLVVGFPHGAVDHHLLARVRDDSTPRGSLARVGATYAVLGGGYAFVWFFLPRVAVTVFLLVTIVHWGTGELYPLIEIAGVHHLGSSTSRLATATIRGCLPILGPLVAFPDRFSTVVSLLVTPFLGTPPAWIAALGDPHVRAAIAASVGGGVVATLALGAARARAVDAALIHRAQPTSQVDAIVRPRTAVGGWLLDACETVLLCAFFLVVPPVLAVGTYFCLWHSLRHVARLITFDDRSTTDLADGRIGRPLWRFTRDALPLTAGGLLVIAGVFVAVPRSPGTPTESIGVYLVAIAVLTLPHTVLVAIADREQGIGPW
ncbi:beta-carotene 15,15'-monooxygenase, Brp/Blh family [Halopenitus malekzadehii]|uniref:Probable beta-carotene 15,15'-dioxygenase n=1 Tax=Halopenitus malekzadehii TaxID=1267564 RepID=A0A1H6HYI7_9EURY|nr:Brp/Blh family beta-carotene 15,15'-dioxygenase [Halopenitus malekzadehii]SEH39243.1 beta-carotene 15,15'-monooxygenase, Brp/Blh family [Halopenitus malekzadehii]